MDYGQKLEQIGSQLKALKKEIELTRLPKPEKGVRKVLFIYDSHHLKNSDKVSFFYELKGRQGKKGLLAETKSEFLSKKIVLSPIEFYHELCSFFKKWRCSYRAIILEQEKVVYGK